MSDHQRPFFLRVPEGYFDMTEAEQKAAAMGPGVGELHLGLATAPPPLEAAAPDCRGGGNLHDPLALRGKQRAVYPSRQYRGTGRRSVTPSMGETGMSRYAAVLLR
jgi:hypothetical protein